jgi:hypothetical protein
MEPYLPSLYRLNERGVKYLVIGTGALWLHLKEFRDRPLSDCDLFVPSDDYANLTQLVQVLLADKWVITVWGEPLQLPLREQQLQNKYYLRCNKFVSSPQPSLLVMDVTYELGWSPHLMGADGRTPLLGVTYKDMAAERVLCSAPSSAASASASASVASAASSLAIPTACIEHVLALKRLRNKPKDRITIIEVESLLGSFARSSSYVPPPPPADSASASASASGAGVSLPAGAGRERSALAQARLQQLAAQRQRRTACGGACAQCSMFDVLLGVVVLLCILRFAWEWTHMRLHQSHSSDSAL